LKKRKPTFNPALPFFKKDWIGNMLNLKNQYINLDGPSEKSFKALLQWQTAKNTLKALKKNQQPQVEVLLNQQYSKNSFDGFVWLGHASFLFHIGGKFCIVDPVFYGVGPLKRKTAMPCAVQSIIGLDYILLSHNHRDHADQKSMQQLCALNPTAIVLTGLEIGNLLRAWKITNTIIEAGWFQQYPTDDALHITYLPAKHWNRRALKDLNEMLWGSFMLQSENLTVYFGADSGMGIHFSMIADLYPTIDYAFLGIGAYMPEWFMYPAHTSPADALVAFKQLNADFLVPMHHATFDLGDEPVFYPKQEMLRLQEEQNCTTVIHAAIGKMYTWQNKSKKK
jgi:L-ascorbate metabolism protein UlaG (beta-lactamase superfamily)